MAIPLPIKPLSKNYRSFIAIAANKKKSRMKKALFFCFYEKKSPFYINVKWTLISLYFRIRMRFFRQTFCRSGIVHQDSFLRKRIIRGRYKGWFVIYNYCSIYNCKKQVLYLLTDFSQV